MKKRRSVLGLCVFSSILMVSLGLGTPVKADTWTYSFKETFVNPFDSADNVSVDLSFSVQEKNFVPNITQLDSFQFLIDGGSIDPSLIFCIECSIDPALSINIQPLQFGPVFVPPCCQHWATDDPSVTISRIQFRPSFTSNSPPNVSLSFLVLPAFSGPAVAQTPWEMTHTTNNPIPEPSTMLLFGSGLAGLAAWRYRKSRNP